MRKELATTLLASPEESGENGDDSVHERLSRHVARLHACRRCPRMASAPVSGGPVVSPVMLVGQAPGDKEPIRGRPFAHTAGRTLFGWFTRACGWSEADFRARVYMAAVCRCFPGKRPAGGDRVPAPDEVANCSAWLRAEIALLRPELVLPVGRLAIAQFLPDTAALRLDAVVGRTFRARYPGDMDDDHAFDVLPLPHPSGASPWHRLEPGKTRLETALALVAAHPAVRVTAAPTITTVEKDAQTVLPVGTGRG